MKRYFFLATFWISLSYSCAEPSQPEINAPAKNEETTVDCEEGRSKLALIIAVGDYANEGDFNYITPASRAWQDINSKNDIPLIEGALMKQGFCKDNIKIIQDNEATKEGIKSAIKNHLIDKAKAGDIVFIHFSGHGQQIIDDNGDEVDGWDEALIPQNAAVKFVEKIYEGQEHLRDDDLEAMLSEIRAKLGADGHMLVTLDACHSGTATRGIGASRGSDIKFAPPGYTGNSNGGDEKLLELKSSTRGENEDHLAPYVVISAASADELNYETFDEEGNKIGSLSYAFSSALAKADQNTTYNGLFDMIRVNMSTLAPRQTPRIEGATDQLVLNGKTQAQHKYYQVKGTIDRQNIILNAGELSGLFEGTKIALYEINADTSKSTPKAFGTIVNAYMFESDVELDRSLSDKEAMTSWAFVKSQNFGNVDVKVKLNIKDNQELAIALKDQLSQQPFVTLVESSPDLQIDLNTQHTVSRGGNNYIQILTKDDYIFYEKSMERDTDFEVKDIVKQTLSFAQANYLRNIELYNKELNVTLEFIPVEVERIGRQTKVKNKLYIKDHTNSSGLVEFKLGESFVFKVTNNGSKDAYYSILDIQPDNTINILIPNPFRTGEEYKIKAGESKELPDIFTVGEPIGLENLKLIATEEVIDLKPLVATRGAQMRSASSPFEKLLSYSYKLDKAGTRGAVTESIPPSSGNIHTILFRISK